MGGAARRIGALAILLAGCGGAAEAGDPGPLTFDRGSGDRDVPDGNIVVVDPGGAPDLAETDGIAGIDAFPPADGTGPSDPGADSGLLCSPRTRFVYVVSEQNRLLQFLPSTGEFTEVGQMDCPSDGTPFSMAIDRRGTAWVLYNDGHIFRVSTEDASCQATSFVPGQSGFDTFGMGFSSDAEGAEAETLYVSELSADGDAARLGTIAFPSLVLTPVGPVPEGSAELTGNGRGELWGYFPGNSPPLVARIDKAGATLVEKFHLDADLLGDVTAWAFAFWGGRFYIFTASYGDASSHVYRLDPGTSDFLEVNPAAGQTIVGAGVSSCAPLEAY